MPLPSPLGLVAAICLLATPAAADCKVGRAADLHFSLARNEIFVPLKVNDTVGSFLLDTGAFHSIIDSSFAIQAGVRWDPHQPRYILSGFGGNTLPVLAGRLRMLEIAGARVPDREMPIHDFAPLRDPNGPKLDGLLGADLLNLLDVEINFGAAQVTLWRLFDCQDIQPLHWTGDYAAIPLKRTGNDHIEIPIWLDGAELQAMLDTGANGGLYLSRQAAIQAGATEAQLAADPRTSGTGIGGAQHGVRHRFRMLLIGKDSYRNVEAVVGAEITKNDRGTATVGLAYLLHHRVWISYGTETLFLQTQPASMVK